MSKPAIVVTVIAVICIEINCQLASPALIEWTDFD